MRLRLAAALSLFLVVAPAGALAAHLTGTNKADRLVGTARADMIDGRAGNDTILGQAGNDTLVGGLGRDRVIGGAGNDSISANGDAARDTIACGMGRDIVSADLADAVAKDCEVTSRQLSTDPISGGGGQHATEVEPDSFSFGNTIVATFQVGRISTGGATAIGFATSTDGARHWRSGFLPGVTALSPQPGSDPRASDPSVAFDAAHNVWLIASLGIGDQFEFLVSRSSDAVHWSLPVVARSSLAGSLDKEWVACDNWPSSPNRGRCYLSYLDVGTGFIATQTTLDGGLTWSSPAQTSFQPAAGLEPNGAQPLPRPDGSLVVVYAVGRAESEDEGGKAESVSDGELFAATSTDGGTTFAASVPIADGESAAVSDLRAPPLPSADVGSDGRLFVAWQDCLTEQPCAHNRIVVSTSGDGRTWTPPTPITAPSAAVTQFVPGIAVDQTTAGTAAHLAMAYYSLQTRCAAGSVCPHIDAWLVRSTNGGATWSTPQRLDAVPMQVDWLPVAGGHFLGDYISTSFVAGRAVPVYALAVAPWGGKLREAIMALQP